MEESDAPEALVPSPEAGMLDLPPEAVVIRDEYIILLEDMIGLQRQVLQSIHDLHRTGHDNAEAVMALLHRSQRGLVSIGALYDLLKVSVEKFEILHAVNADNTVRMQQKLDEMLAMLKARRAATAGELGASSELGAGK